MCRIFGVRRELETPYLKRLYYGGLALLGVWAVAAIAQSINLAIDAPGGGAEGFFFVAACIGVGTVAWRLLCELALGLLMLFP